MDAHQSIGWGVVSGIRRGSPSVPLEAWEPDPKRFSVERWAAHGEYCAVLIRYPDAKWHGGAKICVFKADIAQILYAKELDPHFTDPPTARTPVARFSPDDWGWKQAIDLVERLDK